MFLAIKNATPSEIALIAIHDRPDLVPYLLEFDIDINNQDLRTKSTALHYTLARPRSDLAELLLEKGANGNIVD
jgi:ankyrin repeat protein